MIIFGILLLGLILRLINLNQSLWLDEAVQAITAKNSIANIFQEIVGDFHPPLYHFFMHYWVEIFGSSEIALRMPSVLSGVGTIGIVYLIIKKLTGSKIYSIIAALFLATAPFHIYYSQEARMYSMGTFFMAVSFYYFLRILKGDKGTLKVIFFIATLAALYTDYYAWLGILAQVIYLLIRKKFKFVVCYLLFVICYFPWVPMFLTQIKTGILATKALPGWGELVNLSFLKALPLTFIKFSIGRISFFDKRLYLLILVGLGIIYGGLIIKGIKGMLKENMGLLGVIYCWFFVPLTVAWLVSILVPNFQPFRLLLILPAFYLLLCLGIFSLKSKVLRNGLVALVIIINLSSLAVYYFNPYFHREDWKGLVSFLKNQENSQTVLPSSTSDWPIKYYDPSGKIKLISAANDVNKVNGLSLASKTNKIFYIRYLTSLFDQNEIILAELKEAGYTKVKEVNFNQIPLWEFSKK